MRLYYAFKKMLIYNKIRFLLSVFTIFSQYSNINYIKIPLKLAKKVWVVFLLLLKKLCTTMENFGRALISAYLYAQNA
jgi:hypothetical protein